MFPYSFIFNGGFVIIFSLMFALVFGMIVFTFVKGIGEWSSNNQSPRLTVDAEVAAKRTCVSHHTHHNAGDITGAHGVHTASSTSYYATFQVESGDRLELNVKSSDYGMLAEGDRGRLTFQGTRYLGFERQ